MRRALLLVLLSTSSGLAQTPHKEGDYGGVAPGASSKPDPGERPARAKRPAPRGTLTWIGFEAKDGGAQVFLQSVAPFDVSQQVEGGKLYVYANLTRLGTNTWRLIDTRFFDNPLSRIDARKARGRKGRGRGGIEIAFAFKTAKDAREATVRSEAGPDGMHYVYLTFGPGSGSSPAPAADDVER